MNIDGHFSGFEAISAMMIGNWNVPIMVAQDGPHHLL